MAELCGVPLGHGASRGQPCARPRGHKRKEHASASAVEREREYNADWQRNNGDHVKALNTVSHAKARATRDGVPFSLTARDLPPIPETCPVLGISLPRGFLPTDGGPADASASLDLIRPELGFVPGNLRWISHRAALIKGNATPDELLLVARDALRLGL